MMPNTYVKRDGTVVTYERSRGQLMVCPVCGGTKARRGNVCFWCGTHMKRGLLPPDDDDAPAVYRLQVLTEAGGWRTWRVGHDKDELLHELNREHNKHSRRSNWVRYRRWRVIREITEQSIVWSSDGFKGLNKGEGE